MACCCFGWQIMWNVMLRNPQTFGIRQPWVAMAAPYSSRQVNVRSWVLNLVRRCWVHLWNMQLLSWLIMDGMIGCWNPNSCSRSARCLVDDRQASRIDKAMLAGTQLCFFVMNGLLIWSNRTRYSIMALGNLCESLNQIVPNLWITNLVSSTHCSLSKSSQSRGISWHLL